MPHHGPTPSRIVILGGGYAGLTVAQRLGRQKANVSITLIDAKPAFQERIRLHQMAAGQAFASYAYRKFLDPLGVAFMPAQVSALDPRAATLTACHADGTQRTVPYDHLVYALGSAMDVDAVPGVREHAHALQSVQTAHRVRAALDRSPQARVLVVGAGLTGIETAAELAECRPDLRVTLAVDQPWCEAAVPGGFDKKASDHLYRALRQRGVTLRTGARVTRLRAAVAETGDGQEIAFDICLWTSGFAPPALAGAAGLQVNPRGQIETDACLRSLSHPNIIAVGDAAHASSDDAGVCRMGSATALAMATAGARTLRAVLARQQPPALRFVYLFRNISLGRHDGVVQFVDRRDVPRSIVWTGAAAAAWKEYICQSTLSTIGLGAAGKLPALPPVRTLAQLLQGMRQYA